MKSITATCSCCGMSETYNLSELEEYNLAGYQIFGRNFGLLQNLFPNVPAWIRACAIDQTGDGFCICPKCSAERIEPNKFNENWMDVINFM